MGRNFPFSIRDVARVLDLTIRHGKEGESMDVDCPFCYKKSKMNLNVSKNVYRCNICEESGGMIKLYGDVHNISTGDAYREICELLGCDGKNPAEIGGKFSTHEKTIEVPLRADDETIHQTYSMLLSFLTLATPHKEQLLARGLSPDAIVKFNYKSAPAFGQQGLCTKLIQSGCVVEHVPGVL